VRIMTFSPIALATPIGEHHHGLFHESGHEQPTEPTHTDEISPDSSQRERTPSDDSTVAPTPERSPSRQETNPIDTKGKARSDDSSPSGSSSEAEGEDDTASSDSEEHEGVDKDKWSYADQLKVGDVASKRNYTD
jgi:hypothetical protein